MVRCSYGSFVASDAVPIEGAPTPPDGHVLSDCFQVGPFWVDCLLPLEGDGG